MRRSGPLKRRTPLVAHSTLRRSTSPIPPMSKRRKGQLGRRAEVRQEVLERDGGCVGAEAWPDVACWHPAGEPLDVHEVQKRSRNPRAWLAPTLCVSLCRRHHELTEAEPAKASELGLLLPSWSTGRAV